MSADDLGSAEHRREQLASREPHWYDDPLSGMRAANWATTSATSVCPIATITQSQIPTGPEFCSTSS